MRKKVHRSKEIACHLIYTLRKYKDDDWFGSPTKKWLKCEEFYSSDDEDDGS